MRVRLLALFLLGLGLSHPVAVFAQEADQRATVLHLSQSAERTLLRDLLRVELRVEESGADPRSVQSAINRRMAAALDRAGQTEGAHAETGSYHVGEERPPNRAATWRGGQSLILKSKNAETEGRPVPRFSGAAMAAAAPPVAEPGEAIVRVTVETELLLGQPRP